MDNVAITALTVLLFGANLYIVLNTSPVPILNLFALFLLTPILVYLAIK